MLHRCIEGERVGDDGGEVVGVDRCHDDCPGGVPVPPGDRGESPLLIILPWPPPRWEESSPSGPWPPWWRRVGCPSDIGSPSLFSSVSRSCFLVENRFLYSRRSVTPIALRFQPDFFFGYKLPSTRSRDPTDVRGEHNPPPRAWPLGTPWCISGVVGPRLC